MVALALPLWRRLPVLAPVPDGLSYPRLIASMLALLREERVLQVRGVLALLMFAAFNYLLERAGVALERPAMEVSRIPPSAPSGWRARPARWRPRVRSNGPIKAWANTPAPSRLRFFCWHGGRFR